MNEMFKYKIFRITWIVLLAGTVIDYSYMENIHVFFFSLNLQTASTALLLYIITFLGVMRYKDYKKIFTAIPDRFVILLLVMLLTEAYISSYFSHYRSSALGTAIFRYTLFFICLLCTIAYCNYFKDGKNFIIKSFVYLNFLIIISCILDFHIPQFNNFLVDYLGHMELKHASVEEGVLKYIRPSGFVTDPNLTAVTIVLASLLLLINAGKFKNKWFVYGYIVLAGYGFGMLVSRSALISLIAGLIFLFIFRQVSGISGRTRVIVFCLLFFPVQLLTPQTRIRFEQIFNKQNIKVEAGYGRPVIWRAAWKAFESSPIVGIGTDVFFKDSWKYLDMVADEMRIDRTTFKNKVFFAAGYNINPHNIFLTMLAEYGVIGFVIFMTLTCFYIYRLIREKKWIALMFTGILLFVSCFSNYSPYYKYFILICIVVYTAGKQNLQIEEDEHSNFGQENKPGPLRERLAKFAARLCIESNFIRQLFRSLNFKGKGYIVSFINTPDNLSNDILARCKGVRYKFDIRDSIQKQIYYDTYESENIEAIVKLVKPGWRCFDIGANVGAYSLRIAKELNFNGQVFAFEPEPTNYSRLEENCNLNDFASVIKTFEAAVTSYDGKAALYLSENEQSGWHSLTKFKDIARSQLEVKAVSLDTFVRENSIGSIDLIKVDVEANEFEFLEGAKECLQNRIINWIFIEFNGPRLAEKHRGFSEFLDIFGQYGYVPATVRLNLIEDIKKGRIDSTEICENFMFVLS